MSWSVFEDDDHRARFNVVMSAIGGLAGDYARDCVKTVLLWWGIIVFVLPGLLRWPVSSIPGWLALAAWAAVVVHLALFAFTMSRVFWLVWRQEREVTS